MYSSSIFLLFWVAEVTSIYGQQQWDSGLVKHNMQSWILLSDVPNSGDLFDHFENNEYLCEFPSTLLQDHFSDIPRQVTVM
jgi:hypothetical protein